MKDIGIFGPRDLVNGWTIYMRLDRVDLQEWANVEIKSSAWMRYVRDAIRQQNRDALIVQYPGTSLAVQWLRHHASTAEGTSLIPDPGTKIPQATRCGQKKLFNIHQGKASSIRNQVSFNLSQGSFLSGSQSAAPRLAGMVPFGKFSATQLLVLHLRWTELEIQKWGLAIYVLTSPSR